MRPEARLTVETGAQRHVSHSLVSVRCTPMSRAGSAHAASAISRNHGPGTMTEPHVTRPARARSRNARFAPWLAPKSSTCGTTARDAVKPSASISMGRRYRSAAIPDSLAFRRRG